MITADDHHPHVWDLLRAPEAPAGDTIRVDDAGLIFRGDYVRDGADLVVSGDGQRLVVHDYFTAAHRPRLVAPNGASLPDSVIEALARPLHGVQVAQAGQPPVSDATKAIGRVQSLTGTASVVRNGVTVAIHTGDLVYKGDVLQTDRASGLSVSFLDGTLFSLAASARMVMTEMVYQAGATGNHSLFNLVQGSISFVAGQVAKTGDMKVGTPVATMGIRGTAVQATVQADDGTSRLSVMTEPPSPEHPQGHTGRFDVYDRDDPNDLLFTVSDPNIVAVVHPKGTGDVRVDQVPKTPADIAYENTLVRTLYQGQADAPRLPVYNGPPTGGGTSSSTPPNQILPDQAPAQPPGAPGTQGPAPAAPGSGAPEGVQGPARQPDPPPPSGDAPRTDAVPNAAPGIGPATPPALTGPAVEPPPVVQTAPVPAVPPLQPQPVPADATPPSPQPALVEVVPAPPQPAASQPAAVEAASPVPSVTPAPAAPAPAASALVLGSLAATVTEGGVLAVDAAHGLLAGAGAGLTVVGAHAGSGPDVGVGGASLILAGQYGTLTLQADGTYVYVADHAASLAQGQQAADVFGFSARSGGGATASATLTIAVTGTNDPPASGGSHAIGVLAGGATVVRTAALAGSDPDDPPGQLTYTITSHPHGSFTDAGGTATTTFTQAEVDAGTIVYHHDGTATGGGASDVTFTLTDAAGASVSGTLAVAVTPAGGRVVDGYIAGALVFADANGNGVLDSGEVSTQSDAAGNFTLVGGSGRLVATGGTDISTGLPNLLTLTSPAGSAIIDPLTTLVQSLGGTAAANAQVAAAFGLPSGTDLTALDPVAAAASGSATGRSAYLANVAVADTTALLSAALIGHGVPPDAAYAAILGQIAGLVGSLGSGATLDLASAATGQGLLASAAAALQVGLTAQAVATVAGAAGASNTQLYGPPAANQSLLDHVAATAAAARAQAASLESLLTPPGFVAHAHPIVAQGGSTVLSADNLLASDPNDAAGAITYTITDDPHGSFSLRSVTNGTVQLSPVTRFTQADVDAGRVVYQHDDTRPAGGLERVSFIVSDAAGGSAAGSLDIAVDARPVITTGGAAAAAITAIPIAGNAAPLSQAGQNAVTAGHSLINTLGGPAGFGTSVLAQGDDNSSGAIDITAVFGLQGLNFFGTYYTSLYVNNNGNITFGGPSSTFTPSQITSSSAAIIAPFFADVDTRGGATSPTPGGTSTGSDRVYVNADTVNGVFTVTWDDVGYYSGHIQNPNAFQVQLVSLGGGNFDIVYRYEAVNWTVGDASAGVSAVIGYAAGNGVNFYELPQSGNVAPLRALPATPGNTGIAGVYVFQAFGGTVAPSATLQTTGTIGFTDADAGAHTASGSLDHLSLTTTRGITIPSDTAAALQAALTAQVTQDGATGTVTWSFALPNSAAAFLRPGESLSATYAIAVGDGRATAAPTTVTVTINGVNDAPNVGGDRAIGVAPGGTALVHTADLGATDPDDGPGQITYTITGNPHGSFTRSSLQNGILNQTPVTTFTQADIDAGAVTYRHDGTIPAGGFETVTYTLSDGAGGSAGGTLAVAVSAASPAAVLERVAPGGVQAATATRGVTDLTQRQLDATVAAALASWAAAGASAAQVALLAGATYSIADLSGTALGQESAGHVTIDSDAAGLGWYVDPTPGGNAAFPHAANAAGTDLYTDPSLAAAGHIDLLTTVLHEMGHVLGLADSAAPADIHDLMYADLVAGERRLPVAADVAAATTATVAAASAGRHAAATPAAPGTGHAGPGSSATDAAGTTHAGPTPGTPPVADSNPAAARGPDAGPSTPGLAGIDPVGSDPAPTGPGQTASAVADMAQTGPVPQAADRTDHPTTSPPTTSPAPITQVGATSTGGGDHPAAVVDTRAPVVFAASQAPPVSPGPAASAATDPPPTPAPVLQAVDHTDHPATSPASTSPASTAPASVATASASGGDHPATTQDAGAHAVTASAASQAASGSGSGTATAATDHAATSQGSAAQGATASGADHGATTQGGSTSTTGDGHAATAPAAAGQAAADASHAATQGGAPQAAAAQGTASQGAGTQGTGSHDTASSTAQADLAHMATTHDVFVFSQPAGSSASVQAIHHFAPASDSLDLSFLPDAAVQTIGDYVHIQASAGGGYDLAVRSGSGASFVTIGHFDAGTLHDGDHVSVSVHDHVAQVIALQLHTS